VADLLMPGLQLNPTVSREQLTLRPDMADLLLDEDTAGAADVRVYRWPDPEIRGESLAAGAEVRWGRESLSNLVPQEFAIGTALSTEVDRSSPLGTAVLRMAHAAATGARRERLADRAAANWELGFVNGTTPGARRPTHTITTSVAGAPRVALWARPGAAARVSVVPTGIDMGELNRPGALPALVERLGDPASNPSVEVFLSGSHGEQVAGTWEPGEGSAVIARELPGNLAVDVEVPGPALLVVRDAMVTGWRATLDGASAPVVRADLAWRAVQLPPGRHQVVFTYHQPGLAAGGLLSVAGLLICTALLVGSRREYRRQRTLQESAVAAAQQAA